MIAALSAAHLAAWEFPSGLRRLIIASDNDDAGRGASRCLDARARALGIEAATVTSLRADFNSDRGFLSGSQFKRRVESIFRYR